MVKLRMDILFGNNSAGPNANKASYIQNGDQAAQGIFSALQVLTSGSYFEGALDGNYTLIVFTVTTTATNLRQDYWTTSEYISSAPCQGWIEITDSTTGRVKLYRIVTGNGYYRADNSTINVTLICGPPRWGN